MATLIDAVDDCGSDRLKACRCPTVHLSSILIGHTVERERESLLMMKLPIWEGIHNFGDQSMFATDMLLFLVLCTRNYLVVALEACCSKEEVGLHTRFCCDCLGQDLCNMLHRSLNSLRFATGTILSNLSLLSPAVTK